MARNYESSQTVEEALEAAKAQEEQKPGDYTSAWNERIRSVMEELLNRKPFRYDLNGDALYHQYRDQAVKNGQLAMMDSMGQAAALSGGYGSSYAQNVGQQAYQQELTKVNDRIPELYALAMEQYNQGGQDLLRQYELLNGQENQDYSRYKDALAAWQRENDRLWDIYNSERDFDYGAFRDQIHDEQWEAEFQQSLWRYYTELLEKHKDDDGYMKPFPGLNVVPTEPRVYVS